MRRNVVPVPLALGSALIGSLLASPALARRPWKPRQPPVAPPPAHQLRDISRWPAEPDSPAVVDSNKFRSAVADLCGLQEQAGIQARTGKSESKSDPAAGPALGDLVRYAADRSRVDPFLLAGLVVVRSNCKASFENKHGIGLLGLHPGLYRSEGAPPPPGTSKEWSRASLLDPESNLRLGAELLKMWQDTHAELDLEFGGVPHRGPAAHFIWGDVVRSSGTEDLVLTSRRRLLYIYAQTGDKPTPTPIGLTLVSPLEGAPRVASSGPGEDRAGGKRRHRGLDITATMGEPVRAVAPGKVIFAGANLPGRPRHTLAAEQSAKYRNRRFGAGGLYICIRHPGERDIVTCYMHLDSFSVNEGDTVAAGEQIGRVGRTGVRQSPPHLHFELRINDRCVNPARYLADLVIPPKATQTYHSVMKATRLRRARAKLKS